MLTDTYFAAIERRAHTYAPPPAGFDPLTANPTQLATYGLPPRPNATAEPELFAFWSRLLSPPFRFTIPEFPKRPLPEAILYDIFFRFDPGGRSRNPDFATFRHRETSLNWSGAYITPLRPNRFLFVTGGWTVPTAAVPSVPPEGVGADGGYRSSTWIGFDGHRSRYPGASLPQIGTSQHVKISGGASTTEYGAWWQWWKKNPDPADDPEYAPVPIKNFPVSPGDEILACLLVLSNDEVRFHIKNQTTGIFCTFIVIAPGAIDPLGTTAEWIMERPAVLITRNLYPMPLCTDVNFQYCLAQSAPSLMAPPVTQRLSGNARLINMYERFAKPHRIAFVSKVKKTGPTTARVIYDEAGPPNAVA